MAKSMAASLTDAVRRGYDAARRCDGYGSHAYCDSRDHTALALEALYNRAVRYRVGVGGVDPDRRSAHRRHHRVLGRDDGFQPHCWVGQGRTGILDPIRPGPGASLQSRRLGYNARR